MTDTNTDTNMTKAEQYAKFFTAIVGAIVIAVDEGLVSGVALRWSSAAVAFLTALGVFAIPNRQRNGDDNSQEDNQPDQFNPPEVP